MVGTLALIIGASTAFLALFLQFFGFLNIITLTAPVALFSVAQWLFAPYLINTVYRVKEMKPPTILNQNDGRKIKHARKIKKRLMALKSPESRKEGKVRRSDEKSERRTPDMRPIRKTKRKQRGGGMNWRRDAQYAG